MKVNNDVINVTVIRLRLIFTVYVGHNDDIYVDDQNIRNHKILWNSLNPHDA